MSSNQIETLVVTQNRDTIDRCISFLEQNGYKVTICSSIDDALLVVRSSPPHVILLNWGLKGINVAKVYFFLSEKLKIPCLVFTEDNSARFTSSLMKSHIRHTLFPPIGGQGIHRRIQILLRGKTTKGHKKRIRSSTKFGTIKVAANQVDSDTVWEPVHVDAIHVHSDTQWTNDESSNDGESFAWKGTATIDKKTQLVYFFKGPKKPQYDKTYSKWDGLEGECPILMQERQISKEHSATEEGLNNDKNIFSMLQKNPLTGNYSYIAEEERATEGKATINPETITSALGTFTEASTVAHESTSNDSGSLLEKSVRAVLSEYASLPLLQKSGEQLPCPIALEVLSHRFKGYLVIVAKNNKLPSEFVKDFYSRLQDKMKEGGELMKEATAPILLDTPVSLFDLWSKTGAEFSIARNFFDNETLFTFLSLDLLGAMKEEGEFCEVKFEKWLIGNSTITFDLYLHMPLNQKYILYLKNGSNLEDEKLSKFLQQDIKSIYIRPEEKSAFLKYCIEIKMLSTIKAA